MAGGNGMEAQTSRVLQILGALAKTPQSSVKQISESTLIPSSTIYRLLAPLVASGFVQKTPTRHYCAGPIAVQLAERYHDVAPTTGSVAPYLRRLAEESGELAAYMVVRGTEAVCLEEAESCHTLRASFTVGAAQPLLRGATATALLSRLDAESRRRIFDHYDVPAQQREDIETSCAQARQDGYAVSAGELDPGIWGVSVPIPAVDGIAEGAITLMAPIERSAHRRAQLIQLVRSAADALSGGTR